MKIPIVTYGQAMKYALEDGPACFRPMAASSLYVRVRKDLELVVVFLVFFTTVL